MNKKILIFGVLAALMLVTILFATVVSSNTTTTVKKKESPLFGIRTRLAIGERLEKLKENIKARFIGERVFFLPFGFLRNKIQDNSLASIIILCTWESECYTSPYQCGTYEKYCSIAWPCSNQ